GQDLAEALQRGAGGLEEDVQTLSGEGAREVRGAVRLLLVEDDGQRLRAGLQEVLRDALDERQTRDRHERFVLGEAVSREPAPLPGRGDPGGEGHAGSPSRGGRRAMARSRGQKTREPFGETRTGGMPRAFAPAMSRCGESPTNTARVASIERARSAASK